MSNDTQKKSGVPIVVIGLVFLLMIGGGVWFYSSSKPANNVNTPKVNNTNSPKSPTSQANALPGANPPNQSGSPTATVTLEEFADFQCPQCAAKHPVLNEIKSTYGSRIHFIYRNYPLPMHDKSYEAAVAAQAAGMQNPNKFWEMQNLLFSNQDRWKEDPNYKQTWKDYAQKIGLDISKWETDMAGIGAKSLVDADIQRGKSLGINSTPTLYINGTDIPFPQMTVDGLRQLIDAELQKAAPPAKMANTANTGNSNK